MRRAKRLQQGTEHGEGRTEPASYHCYCFDSLPASNMAASGTMAGAAYQSLHEAHLCNMLSTE